MENNEIQTIITALGTGFGEEGEGEEATSGGFNISKLRYHKIIIMTDADVAGSHIRTLLLTFLYRNMPDLFYNNHIYIAQPPLYKISQGKKFNYAYNEEERVVFVERFKKENTKTKITLQRYKGLGEMNPEQLWETTMDPEKRTLLLVGVEHLGKADKTFTELMGEEVEPRRNFIETHAKFVTILDV